MGNNTDRFPLPLQLFKYVDRVFQSVFVECSEPLIQEKRVDLNIFPGKARAVRPNSRIALWLALQAAIAALFRMDIPVPPCTAVKTMQAV